VNDFEHSLPFQLLLTLPAVLMHCRRRGWIRNFLQPFIETNRPSRLPHFLCIGLYIGWHPQPDAPSLEYQRVPFYPFHLPRPHHFPLFNNLFLFSLRLLLSTNFACIFSAIFSYLSFSSLAFRRSLIAWMRRFRSSSFAAFISRSSDFVACSAFLSSMRLV
jgi:hypothetical protein